MSVIRNTNTKIILRLPEKSDRELVGLSASLNDEQIKELAKLEQGVAAIYQNDWVEPVLVKVNKCNLSEVQYSFDEKADSRNIPKIKAQIIRFLIQGRVSEQLDYNVDEIEANLTFLGLSSSMREFIEETILEYRETGNISVWEENNFDKLARRVTLLLEARAKVETAVTTSADNAELTEHLRGFVNKAIQNCTLEEEVFLSQCLMKDFSIGKSENEIREKIYMAWFDDVAEGKVLL
jgi:hypothetical protein